MLKEILAPSDGRPPIIRTEPRAPVIGQRVTEENRLAAHGDDLASRRYERM